MDPRFLRYQRTDERERFNLTVVKPFYLFEEDYDWTDVADRLQGPETILHQLRARSIIKLLGSVSPPAPFLDVGCGSGLLLRHLPVGSIGIDLNPRNIARAQRYAPNAKVVKGDAEQLPFADGQFGTVLCTEVLEHLVFPEHAIAEIRRVLRPDGVFIGSVPRQSWLWGMRRFSVTCPASEPFHNEMHRNELVGLLAPFPQVKIFRAWWLMQYFFVAKKTATA